MFNKIAGAVLGTLLVLVALRIVGEAIFEPEEPAHEEETHENGEAAAVIDTTAGQEVAGLCTGCHTVDEGGPHGFGPNLFGIVGRPVGGVDGFGYSDALLAMNAEGLVWTEELLDAFIHNPAEAAPGTTMPFGGIANDEDRENLVIYLATLTADGAAMAEGDDEHGGDDAAPGDDAAMDDDAPMDDAGAGGDVVAMLLAGGDAEAGAAVAGQCAGCHTLNEGGANGFGPNLYGLVGRAVGGVEGFNYSEALATLNAEGAVWDAELLDAFLENPAGAIPGNGMPFGGIGDATDRADLMAYLATLGAAPAEPAEDAAPAEDAPAEDAAPVDEAPAEDAAPVDEAAAEGGDVVAMLLAGGDAEAGAAAAGQCAGCHTLTEGGANGFGPNLFGIVGRAVGGVEGFNYSEALAALNAEGATWDAELLDAFLENPAAAIPGNGMPFGGIGDETERANLLAYLATLMAASEAAAVDDPDPPAAADTAAPVDDAAAPEAAALPVEGDTPVAEDAAPPAEVAAPEGDTPAEDAAPVAEAAPPPDEEAAPVDEAAPAEDAPVAEAAPEEDAAPADEAPVDGPAADDGVAARVAAADAAAGEDIAGQCGFCHTFNEGGATSVGPNLFAIVDRIVGAVDGFLYSEALLGLNEEGTTWSVDLLDAFIADPAAAIPGNRMPFAGIPDETERANLIAYLVTLVPGAAEAAETPVEEAPVEEVALEPAAFTVFQANWGDLQYGLACAECHGADLGGGAGPALTGDDFVDTWTGQTVADFLAQARDGDGHPGAAVTDEDYAAIVAFILRENGANGGPTALPDETEAQAALTLF